MVGHSAKSNLFDKNLMASLAWPVNFNLSLRSFEPSVRGVRHLIDLALGSPYPVPPQIVFVSSVGVFRGE